MIYCICDPSTNDFGGFPDFTFDLEGKTYTIPPKSYLSNVFSFCTVDVMYMSGLNNWVLGLNFFHNYYVVFDVQNQRLGFADSIYRQESQVISLI